MTPSFRLGLFLLCAGGAFSAACEVGRQRANAPSQPQITPGPVAPAAVAHAAATPVEVMQTPSPRQRLSAPLYLPGSSSRRMVNFEVADGMAVMEGDILLGPVSSLAMRYGMPWLPAGNVKGAVALSNQSHLWPNGEIPYVIDPSATSKTDWINWAIQQVNETELNVRPRTAADSDYVVFTASGSGCTSYLGRIRGAQEIQVSGCGKGSIIHEILHAAGFYHEQSRGDRDEFVTIVWDEIVPDYHFAFEKRDGRGQDIGPYDYGSIMHYSGMAFSRTGKPTIIPKQSGASIGQRNGLSAHDKAAIATLYGAGTPSVPPVTTPPSTTPPTTTPPTVTPPSTSPANGSFVGSYTSQRGNVTCSQSGVSVHCQYPGGAMACAANGPQLNCGWSGGGQGRAVFQRQSNGVVAGTWGDAFSANNRGAWDLVPSGQSTAPPAATPPPSTPSTPPSASAPLSGNYTTTRGPMACTEGTTSLSCGFQESGTQGRLDCTKGGNGQTLSCNWVTFLPRPGSGRAVFTRQSSSTRNFTGTWGHFYATAGGGKWDLTGQ